MQEDFNKLIDSLKKCEKCKEQFGFKPHPVFLGNINSKIVQISQAPSQSVHKTLKPFTDKSGDRLKYEWYKIDDETFYNPGNFYIAALAHCYPGKDKNGNDRKPPKICYETWVRKELEYINNKIYIIIGANAAKVFFPKEKFDDLIFKNNYINDKLAIVLPHPSPLNIRWFKKHPEFEKRIYEVRKILYDVLEKWKSTFLSIFLIWFNMKKIIIITLLILNLLIYIPAIAQTRKLILSNKTITIDPGHGGKDVGTSFKDIYEKDINLSISLYLKEELENYGANVIMTRIDDYDLSTPNASRRKKSDFDNRIKIANENNSDLVISIHQNYYKDSKYKGTQIFYKGSKKLADYLQKNINENRKIKKISNSLYMYNKIKSDVLLIECGFLSNSSDRNKLIDKTYQKEYSKTLSKNIVKYFKENSK